MRRWLAKVRRYGGGESVLGYYEDLGPAQERVARWNLDYQTDAAYVEAWDAVKAADWPTTGYRNYWNRLSGAQS